MSIKNIIFDLGGVILNIDYQLTEKAFVQLGCANFHDLYSQARQTTLFDDFEEGKIDEAAFFFKLKELSGLDVSYLDLKKAWNAMLISLPESNYKMLGELSKKYRLFLLSNTNETHISAFTKLVEKVCPISEFEGVFEKVYYSNRIGLKKPGVAPFQKIILENDLNPNETLFIDDSTQHVEGARKAGLRAELLPRGRSTEEFLKEISIL
jgi:putative hydrolase of the HAD superfamily